MERFAFQPGSREAGWWQQRARGTYMISVRLQLLPTGLISMLSYFLGLMYSDVVLAHLQLRFPFTSRMAGRERRWHLTGTDSADRDAAMLGAKGSFTDLYLGSLLPHTAPKSSTKPLQRTVAFSPGNKAK